MRVRLDAFLRDEKDLCAHVIANLTPEYFERYRDRRLAGSGLHGRPIAPGSVRRELTMLKRVAFDRVHPIKRNTQHSPPDLSWFAANVNHIGCKPP